MAKKRDFFDSEIFIYIFVIRDPKEEKNRAYAHCSQTIESSSSPFFRILRISEIGGVHKPTKTKKGLSVKIKLIQRFFFPAWIKENWPLSFHSHILTSRLGCQYGNIFRHKIWLAQMSSILVGDFEFVCFSFTKIRAILKRGLGEIFCYCIWSCILQFEEWRPWLNSAEVRG